MLNLPCTNTVIVYACYQLSVIMSDLWFPILAITQLIICYPILHQCHRKIEVRWERKKTDKRNIYTCLHSGKKHMNPLGTWQSSFQKHMACNPLPITNHQVMSKESPYTSFGWWSLDHIKLSLAAHSCVWLLYPWLYTCNASISAYPHLQVTNNTRRR